MRKYVCIVFLMFLGFSCAAQKIEVKKDMILVNGAQYAIIQQYGCRVVDSPCAYLIRSIDGRKLFAIKQQYFVEKGQGSIPYLEYIFFTSRKTAETDFPSGVSLLGPSQMAKRIVQLGLLDNGLLNEEAAYDFIIHNGTPYTDKKRQQQPGSGPHLRN